MRAGGDGEDDRLAWLYQTIAMDGDNAFERPAGRRLAGDAGDFLFRHAGIMLDFERRERAAFVAAKPGEGDERANVAAPLRQIGGFGRGIENFLSERAR